MKNSLVTDRNLDPITPKFVNNICDSHKEKIRKKLVWYEFWDCIKFFKNQGQEYSMLVGFLIKTR